jgi:cobalt transporter subunit CbtA
LSAVIAGLITGVLFTLVQMVTTVPLIAQAEVYEQSENSGASDPAHDHSAHDHASETWEPKNNVERTLYTGLTSVVVAIGYALLIGACLSQMRSAGALTGLMLGLAGFLVFQLAPALGLPPRPPGSPYADLHARQLWWIGTALSTALALGAWVYARSHSKVLWVPVGIALVVVPHIIGAPNAIEGQATIVPQELAQRFAIAALFAAAVFWILLGSIQGYVFRRLVQR